MKLDGKLPDQSSSFSFFMVKGLDLFAELGVATLKCVFYRISIVPKFEVKEFQAQVVANL